MDRSFGNKMQRLLSLSRQILTEICFLRRELRPLSSTQIFKFLHLKGLCLSCLVCFDYNVNREEKFFCNSKKVIGLDWQKNNFARALHFFVHFLAVVALLRHEIHNFIRPDGGLSIRWAQPQNFLFVFVILDTVPSNSTQKISPTFDKLNDIK